MTMLASLKLAKRVLFETDKRLLWKLAYNMGFKGALSVHQHKRRMQRGQFFPPFLYVSIINTCNLRCQGCWVDVSMKQQTISPDAFHKLVREAQADGERVLRHRRRRAVHAPAPARHARGAPGLLLPDLHQRPLHHARTREADVATRQRHAADFVSKEREIVSDERRGRAGVLTKTMQGLHNALDAGVFTGVCTSLRRTNIDDTAEGRVDRPADRDGRAVHVVPRLPADGTAPEPGPVPDAGAGAPCAEVRRRDAGEEADRHHRRVPRRRGEGAVPGRERHQPPHQPVGRHRAVPDRAVLEGVDPRDGGRPAAAEGEVPVSRRSSRTSASSRPRRPAGASCWNGPTCSKKLVEAHGAKDATARQTALAELDAMTPRTRSTTRREMPEKNVFYRLAKRLFFNDFGVYTGHDARHAESSAPAVLGK